jgi:hypothetical protein
MKKVKSFMLFCIYYLLFGPSFQIVRAQSLVDTIKVISYNVGNLGTAPSSSCPLFNFNLKSSYLKTILKYEKPDVIAMIKMNASSGFCLDTIINYVLDSVCLGCWNHGTYTIESSYPKVNMLYFNKHKFGFVNTAIVYNLDKNISDITLHKLFYKASDLSLTHDTIFINFVVAHLKSGANNTADRATEITGAMAWLNAHLSNNENIVFMGDLNTTSSNESCFQTLINPTNSNLKFFDPPNQLGNWDSQPNNFANYLTQSTRTSDPGDCNATGGMDNRFDHILLNTSLMNGAHSFKYMAGSYIVIGQDGNHVNKAIIDPPTNPFIPSNLINALYNMSEHLPVALSLIVNDTSVSGMPSLSNQEASFELYPNPSNTEISIKACGKSKIESIKLVSTLGEEIFSNKIDSNQTNLNVSNFSKGIYFLQILDENNKIATKRILIH